MLLWHGGYDLDGEIMRGGVARCVCDGRFYRVIARLARIDLACAGKARMPVGIIAVADVVIQVKGGACEVVYGRAFGEYGRLGAVG